MSKKTVSVCMTSYNGEAFIYEQIVSILQSDEVDELIISDDGSTDGTLEIIGSIDDTRINLVGGPKKGVVRNVEFALRHASGNYIFLADQDDVWLPDKVNIMCDALRTADLVISDAIIVDAELNELSASFFKVNKTGPGFFRNLYKSGYLGASLAVRKDVLDYTLPFPSGIGMHDWWMGLCTEFNGRVLFIDNKLILYRRHGANQSQTGDISTTSLSRKIACRLSMVTSLVKRQISLGRLSGRG